MCRSSYLSFFGSVSSDQNVSHTKDKHLYKSDLAQKAGELDIEDLRADLGQVFRKSGLAQKTSKLKKYRAGSC